jgi:putative ABC transport system permease protein
MTIRLPGDLPVRLDFHLDGRVLAYAVALTTASALLVGLVGARRASRTSADEALHDHGQGSTSVTGGHRIRKALVVTQVAVCFVLLVASGLFMGSLGEAEHASFGFRPEGVLNLQMDVAQLGYPESKGQALFDEVQRRVGRLGRVEDLAFAFSVPMGYVQLSSRLDVQGLPVAPGERAISGKNIVGPRYFSTMGIPIERGRSFADADEKGSRPVAIVNRRLAEMLWRSPRCLY